MTTTTRLTSDATREQIADAVELLPSMTRKAYDALLPMLYAEPGFSDVTWDEVAVEAGLSPEQMSGCATRLTECGLVWVDEVDKWSACDHPFVHALAHDLGYAQR